MSMSGDSYISDIKLDEIRKEYGDKVVSFSKVKQQIEKWYEYFELSYPLSSVNNYRDSWFHYRKIWMERSFYEVTCQMATFNEHLQRAEKDAIVNFFQIISQELEFWYYIKNENIPEEWLESIRHNVAEVRDASNLEESRNNLWVCRLFEKYKCSEQEASYALVYVAQKYFLNSEEERRQLQKLLHLVKNTTLKIRLDAIDIRRIEYPGEYLGLYEEYYKKLCTFFEKEEERGLFYLLGMTNVVKANIENYKLEKKLKIAE